MIIFVNVDEKQKFESHFLGFDSELKISNYST
jgi:hypothetical protein